MDDIFDQDASEDVLMEKEHNRIKEKFVTMGVKEGILEKKYVQDENVVSEKFIEGFNKTIEVKRLIGRLAMLEYIMGKITVNKEGNEDKIKTLNEILDRIGKEDNAKIEAEIEELIKSTHKLLAEP